jgi:hypothetical protein
MRGRKGTARANDDSGLIIGDKYKIISDKFAVILMEKKVVSGKPKWKELYYFSNPQNALDALVDKEIMETGFKDFETVCKKQDELYKLIKSIDDDKLPQLRES